MSKILITSGDSFTEGANKWPSVLAKKLDMKCLNVALGGKGNESIHNNMMDILCNTSKRKIGLVICLWSEFVRWDFFGQAFRLYPNNYHKQPDLIQKSVRYIHSFQNHCELYKLPYLQAQAFHPTGNRDRDDAKFLLDTPQFDHINSKFLGWPIFKELGGFSGDHWLTDEHRISKEDMHPNNEGHEFIADFFYRKYIEFYDD